MNILTEPLPEAIEIGGNRYEVNTDFRNWIRFESLMSDGTVPLEKRVVPMIRCCYKEGGALPPSAKEMLQGILWFYTGGEKQEEKKGETRTPQKQNRVYSFSYDAEYIYSAFLTQYGIDLMKEDMHWWRFLALFRGLGEEQKITKIMGYRSIDLSEIKDKTQKKHYRKMKQLFRLPDGRSEEQKEADFVSQMEGFF